MIFITVGTHEQQFNRLIKYVDDLVKNKIIKDNVIMQTGYSTYEPKFCQWKKVYKYDDMIRLMDEAKIIITHGGPSSFIMAIQHGKIPIVVPRQSKYEEHVNDHQLEFCREVDKRMGNIIIVEKINMLEKIILEYEKIISNKNSEVLSNNYKFNEEFKEVILALFQ